ncbi:sn-glycerol-3-phosphate ABC transporter ATP-binding protein UgpC [candidate division KSB1 bacterium]|nr:MAG: sn-glycerol-3-phosphate ABC transporter ATP-binding protein UgpC [candidate division KSB1 bacterium]
MAQIELHNVQKNFGTNAVIHDITFAVKNGEFVVLVGPSGCGKSTILRLIAGLETPTAGEISIGGRVMNDVPARDRDIAMVFQSYALYPHMTVFENMAFALKMRKLSKPEIEQRVREAADFLGLADLLQRKPKQLSGGQRQRVALGRALVRKPQVFLFDEPLSNLDAKLRTHTRTELARLHKQLAATMVYVTHDQVEAMTLGQRIVVLKDGAIQQVDTPLNVYRRPANRFVAGFIGSPAMNFVRGEKRDREYVSAGIRFPLPDSVRNVSGKEIVLGLRPEQLRIGKAGDGCVNFNVFVEVVEPLGNELLIYGRVNDERLVIRAEAGAEIVPDDRPSIWFDPQQVHYFDGATDVSLR